MRPLTAEAEIAHFGAKDLVAADARVEHPRRKGRGGCRRVRCRRAIFPRASSRRWGRLKPRWPRPPRPCKLTISLSLQGTPIANEWEIWVYPPKVNIEPPKGLVVSKVWNDEVKSTLAKGGRVLLFATANSSQSLPGRFLPVFWSPVWFPTQKPNTMGILCDPKHPALADFPTDFYSNWQWYELLDHSRSMILDDTPAEFRPIVQVIDNFARNHKLGVIFEARVGPADCWSAASICRAWSRSSRPRGSCWPAFSGMRAPRRFSRSRNCRPRRWTNSSPRPSAG